MRDRDRDVRARYQEAGAAGAEDPHGQGGRRGLGRGLGAGLALVLTLAGAAACGDKEVEYSGIGKWRFEHTTLADAKEGVCQPTDLTDGRKATWCFANKPFKIGAKTAELDLYFLGTEPTAPLIEIQVKVRGCDEDELTQWLRTNFGAQVDARPKRGYWQNPHMWIGALLPADPGRCVIHMLPVSEQAEIARLKGL